MERDAVSFAVQYNRAKTEGCNRMSRQQDTPPMFLDLIDGLIKTPIGIQVKQGTIL